MMQQGISFGYNFNYANFANVGITRTWQVCKNDYDVGYALASTDRTPGEKQKIRKQKFMINVLSNISQYLIINAVMLKFDKQVNRNTLIAVGIPFAINLLIDVVSRTKWGQDLADKMALNKSQDSTIIKPEPQHFEPAEVKPLKTKFDPALQEYIDKNLKGSNVSFGVSYTTVHILGKLVNKIRGSAAQTYDVYSASNQLNLPQDQVRELTALKFLREMSSQLIENIVYFTVMLKLKKKIDKSFAMAVFIPAAMSIAFDLISRSKAFDFLKDWSKNMFKNKSGIDPDSLIRKNKKSFDSVEGFKFYLERKYAANTQNK